MKKFLLTLGLAIATYSSYAQWTNTTPDISNTNSGNVGIGTTPTEKLEVNGAVKVTGPINASNISANSTYIDNYGGESRVLSYGSNTSTRGGFSFFHATSNNALQQTALRIDNIGKVGIGTSTPEALLTLNTGTYSTDAELLFSTQGDARGRIIGGDVPGGSGKLGFDVVTAQGSPDAFLRAMTILNNGHVGIGTATPHSIFEVNGNTGILVNHSTTTPGSIIPIAVGSQRFNGTAESGIAGMYHVESGSGGFGQAGALAFYTSSNDAIATEKVRIATNGYVGIGTDKPDARLAVNGTIHSTEVKVDAVVPTPDYV